MNQIAPIVIENTVPPIADHPLSISVALCTYQGARYLSEQLESLLAQQRLPDEIVAFDDGSNDGTLEQLSTFATHAVAQGIKVSVHRNPVNLGYVRNFTQALLATRGDLVFLCDQDDVWHSHKIARFAEEFELRPELLMLHSNADLVDANGARLHRTVFNAFDVGPEEISAIHAGEAFNVLLKCNVVTGATMAIRRSVIETGFEVPQHWIHDEWVAMLAAARGRVDCLEEATINYRQHDNNQVGVRPRRFTALVTGDGISRIDFMKRLLARTQSLMDQVATGKLYLDEPAMGMLSERLKHAQLRAQLPLGIASRIAAISKEYASGRYVRFSNGIRSVLSDLLKVRG